MKSMRSEYPVERLCLAFEVSRSGLYAWLKGEPSPRAQEDAALKVAIQAVHRQSRETYGYPSYSARTARAGLCRRS